MQQPMVESIPAFISQEGRKDLSPNVIFKLEQLVRKLKLVCIEDKAEALNNSGIINTYLNKFDEAVSDFNKSLSFDYCEETFSNYLLALERTGSYLQAIKEGGDYLEFHPNNKIVLEILYSIANKYPSKEGKQIIEKFINFHSDLDEEVDFDRLINQFDEDLYLLNKLDIDLDFFNLISNIAFLEVKKIQVGHVTFRHYVNDCGQLCVTVIAQDLSKNDIRLLNRNFDLKIQELIEQQKIPFELYADHLLKLVFGFGIMSNETEVA